MMKSFFLYSAWLIFWVWLGDILTPFFFPYSSTSVARDIGQGAFSCITASFIQTAYYLLLAFGIFLIHKWRSTVYRNRFSAKSESYAAAVLKLNRKANIESVVWAITWSILSYFYLILRASSEMFGDCDNLDLSCGCFDTEKTFFIFAYALSMALGVTHIKFMAYSRSSS